MREKTFIPTHSRTFSHIFISLFTNNMYNAIHSTSHISHNPFQSHIHRSFLFFASTRHTFIIHFHFLQALSFWTIFVHSHSHHSFSFFASNLLDYLCSVTPSPFIFIFCKHSSSGLSLFSHTFIIHFHSLQAFIILD